MVKKVAVGHWECEYCGAAFLNKIEAINHVVDCEYRYERYD